MRNSDGLIGDTQRQRRPLLTPRQADLACIWADVLVLERREEDARRAHEAIQATVGAPPGTDRVTQNVAKDNGQGKV